MSLTIKTARKVSADDEEIGFRIRKIRQDKNISQTHVARALGISFQQFQKYEQGYNRISASRLISIAKILGVTPHDILHWSNDLIPEVPSELECKKLDRQAAALWQKIQSQRCRHALMILMKTINDESGLHPEVGGKSQIVSIEVE